MTLHSIIAAATRVVPPAFLLLALAGCGSDSAQDFSACGNAQLDTGEQCDDGNLIDTDDCTSACRPARCGDGVVQAGVEACDGSDLQAATCDSLGFEGFRPACSGSCEIDPSACGAPFTPTPTAPPPSATPTGTATATATATLEAGVPTSTPTSTFTPTPSPTATPDPCGDGLLGADETCETCPADCTAEACEASGTDATFDVLLQPLEPQDVIAATIRLAYRSSVINLPGTGPDPSVRQRVRAFPPIPSPFIVIDADYVLTVVIGRASPPLEGPIFNVRFETCLGAPPPTLSDFTCFVDGCAGGGGSLACRCSVAEPAP